MFWISQPKSAGSSLACTLAKILKANYVNGRVYEHKKIYCEGFTELQKWHNTMIPRTAKFLYGYCTGTKNVYKEHILPTKEHMKIIRNFKYDIMILLRNPIDSIDCYKRFDLNEIKKRHGRSGIVNLIEIKKDINLFYNRYMKIKKENHSHLLFITFEDIINNFSKTLKKIFEHYKLILPKNYENIKLKKIKYTGIGEKRSKERLNLEQLMKREWENVSPRIAHIQFNDEDRFSLRFKTLVTDKINLKNKIIIDYGCGGGVAGKYFLDNFNIKKYIGYDIAERSLNSAKKRLKKYKNTKFYLIADHDIKFKQEKSDVFCSFSCLMHFPDELYLKRFLKNVNECNAEIVILEIRNKNIGTVFKKQPYKNFDDLIKACITNPEYISKNLTNYILYEKTNQNTAPTNCQILYYKRKYD